MFYTIRSTMLAVSAAGLIGVGTTQAQARHTDYCFQGECFGFESETHMVQALEYMEKAYQVRHVPRLSRIHIYKALLELRYADREVGSGRAKHYLQFGQVGLRKFMLTGRIGELDRAAGHVADAILAEQQFHRRHVRHNRHSQGQGRPDSARPGNRPGQADWGYQPQSGGVFQVGGDWGGFRIRF